MLTLSKCLERMMEFQKTNGIVKQCVTNTQYLYDSIKANCPGGTLMKAEACIVVAEYPEIKTIELINHIALRFEDRILDPSYEVYSKENKSYYTTIADLMGAVEDGYFEKVEGGQSLFRETVSNHVHFLGLAKAINDGGLLVCDKEFYYAQADYVEQGRISNSDS